jgi:hypothetical protein
MPRWTKRPTKKVPFDRMHKVPMLHRGSGDTILLRNEPVTLEEAKILVSAGTVDCRDTHIVKLLSGG